MADDPGTPTLFGWDASDYDYARGMRTRHVTAAAAEGIAFLTHKITEGTWTIHYHAGEMVAAAAEAGMPAAGFYIVTRTPGPSIEAQVDFAVGQADRQWPGWRDFAGFFWQVDLEHWGYDDVSPVHGVRMCEVLRERTGKAAVLYAPRWAYGDSIPGSDPLWASHYGSNPDLHWSDAYDAGGGDSHPGWRAYSGRVPAILQYGSRTTIGGQRICDANAFRGSVEEFLTLINGGVDDMSARTETHIDYLAWRLEAIVHLRDTVLGGPGKGEPVAIVQLLRTIAAKAGVDEAELTAITEAARAGAEEGAVAAADELAAAIVAQLPDGQLTRGDVEAAVRGVLGGLDGATPGGSES